MTTRSTLARAVIRRVKGAVRQQPDASAPRIDKIELTRYVGPGRSLSRSRGMIVCLKSQSAEVKLIGYGEAAVSAGQADAAWRTLQKIASGIAGSPVPAGDVRDPLSKLKGWRAVTRVDRAAARAAKQAFEMAVLDLWMKAHGRSPGDLWGKPEQPAQTIVQQVYRLPKAPPDTTRDTLSASLDGDAGQSWAVKLKSTGDPELDLPWLCRAAEIEQKRGRSRPLWLTDVSLEMAEATDFVRRIAEVMRRGDIASAVLLEEPLVRSSLTKLQERSVLPKAGERSPLAHLQKIADDALGYDQRAKTPVRLTILASESVNASSQVRKLCEAPAVGGLHLSVARFGSLLEVREAAKLAKRTNPDVAVILGGARGSRLTSLALEQLTQGTPEIDRHTPETPATGWPTLALECDADGAEGNSQGLFTGLDVSELAGVADGLASVPSVPRAVTGEQPNRFPDHPLLGVGLSPRSMLLEVEALLAGWRTRRLARHYFLAEHPDSHRTIGFFDSESSGTSAAASVVALRKGVARDLLAAQGLPVPPGAFFPAGQKAKAQEFGMTLGFPLVVKPGGGSKGTAVTPGVSSADELETALAEVAACAYADSGIVVERFVGGNDHRVLTTAGEVLSVVRRDPASVIGDGERTVEELVLASNVARRENPHLARRLIPLEARVDALLRRQGLTRQSVPPSGQKVQLSAAANLHQGGDSHELLDSTHPTVLELAKAAVAAVPGLPHAGLDILMEDHRLAVDEQEIHIIEVNSRAVQTVHHFPMFGPPRNVSAALVRETATNAGVSAPTGGDDMAVRLVALGRVQGVGYRRWMVRAAAQLGITGWVSNAADADQVHAHIQGPASNVGLLLRLAFNGPQEATVAEVKAEAVGFIPSTGFAIKTEGRS